MSAVDAAQGAFCGLGESRQRWFRLVAMAIDLGTCLGHRSSDDEIYQIAPQPVLFILRERH